MGKIKFYEQAVHQLLLSYPETRDNDYLLYDKMCAYNGIDTEDISVANFLHNRRDMGFPNWETVTRVRRKLQEMYPDLRKGTYNKRQAEQETYKAYARGGNV